MYAVIPKKFGKPLWTVAVDPQGGVGGGSKLSRLLRYLVLS